MKKLLLAVVLSVLCSMPAQAAEDFVLWTNQTFTADPTTYPNPPVGWPADGAVAISPAISNNNGLTSARIVINYSTLVPNRDTAPASYLLTAVVEEEVASGQWVPICMQYQPINDTTTGKRIVQVAPGYVENPGTDNILAIGGTTLVRESECNGQIGSKFRVKLVVDDQSSTAPLTSVTITANGRKY